MAWRATAIAVCWCLLRDVDAANRFVRGKINDPGNTYSVGIGDAMHLLRYLFPRDPTLPLADLDCHAAADVNDDGRINVTDAMHLLLFLFQSGPRPPEPYPACGADPTPDQLSCDAYASCASDPSFYGQPIVDDVVVFIVVASGSMLDSGEYAVAKREILRLLLILSPATEIGIVINGQDVAQFPTSGQVTRLDNPDALNDAIQFVRRAPGGHAKCVKDGLLAAVGLARSAVGRARSIYLLSDSNSYCPGHDPEAYLAETLCEVTVANAGAAAIHVLGCFSVMKIEKDFCRDLAGQNMGN